MCADASPGQHASSVPHAHDNQRGWKKRFQVLLDRLYDARLLRNPDLANIARLAAEWPVRRVLITAVEVPARSEALNTLIRTLQATRHTVTIDRAAMEPGKGKFENISTALERHDLQAFDWIFVVDDDVVLPPRFLDQFIFLCEKFNLVISQPAHKFCSFATWPVTRRSLGTLVRRTRFVECGPVTAFHGSTLADVLPFPPSRWSWGLDFLWSETALRKDWTIGVVDALPMRHTRPVGGDYTLDGARVAMKQLLQERGVSRHRREYMVTTARWKRLPAWRTPGSHPPK